ncbi:carboxypeptidase-like regulatory domain-containing protein, partial [Patescibacteria group bacterium]|nr:carboxypeptidase-like regulatory domain-containing protein [Patescibacteria group bacterium]
DLTLRTTPAVRGYFNITGVVYNGCGSSPILPPVASVKLQNLDGSIVILESGQKAETTTGQQGDYQFNGIPITENPIQFKLFVGRMGQDKTKLVYISDVSDGQTLTVNTSLMSQSDLGSIVGRVIEKNTQAPIKVGTGETLKVIIENPLDNSTQEIPVQSDGTFNATNIDQKHLSTPVKLKAVYTRTENGEQKEYIGYAHIQAGVGDYVLLGCTVTGVKVEIDVSGQPPTANEKKVIVLDQSNNGINDAQVTVAEWIVENDIGSWIDRDTKTTSTITNPDDSTADGVAVFNHNYTIFKYTASKEGYGNAEKECKPGENCQTVIMHLKQGEDPVNPSSTDVEYVFQFFEGPKTTGENQIKVSKAFASTFGIDYFDNFAENTPFAQHNVFGFIKKKIGPFERGKWQILPSGQWQTWEEFETWAKANAGVSKIEWDTAFVPGATAKKPIAKDTYEYTLKVTFKDAASRSQFAKTLFNQLQIIIVPKGDNADKVTYDSASVDPRMYIADDTNGNRIYIAPLVFRFNIDAGYLANMKLSEIVKRAVDVGGGIFGRFVRGITGPIAVASKFIVKEVGDVTNTQGQQEETSSLRPGETLVGEYKFDENGAIFEPNFGVGNYRWYITSLSKYKGDRRSDSFTISSINESKIIEVPLCFADNGIYELNDQGINYKYFGNLGSGYFRLSSAVNLAKGTINKAQVNNIVYLGDSNTPLNTSGGYFDGSITVCQTTGGQSQDKVISGKNIIVTDKLLTAINNTGAASQKNQILATKLTELSGYPFYNGLTSTQKTSWNRIARAVDATGNPSQVYQLFIAESQIENYINTDDVAAQPESLYSLSMAAYKNRGAIIKQRIEQLGSNSAEQNVAKAIVRYALETAGANGTTDNNLYQPQGRQLSQTIYSVAQIKSGNWLQSNYRSLSAGSKISITYTQLISAIKGNKAADAVRAAIVSFNNWVDSLRGITNTGTVEGQVLRNGQGVKDVLVTIGSKVAVTNSNGDFKITRVPMGSQVVDIKDRKTSAVLPLKNPGMKVNVIKNQTITTTIRLNQ